MNKFRFLTSGESHGKCLTAIIEGIPAGFDNTGMPIGLQLQADCLNETKLLNVAFKLEEAVQFNYSIPSMTLV